MAHEDRYTPKQFRDALTRALPLMEPHQAAAVRLLLDYNHGRIVEEPTWLRQFVAMGAHGHKASMRWTRLARALSGDDDIPSDLTEAVAPYSDTERSMMRVAADLGSDRWLTSRWGPSTCSQVVAALTAALTPHVEVRGRRVVNNHISGSAGLIFQAGSIGGVDTTGESR